MLQPSGITAKLHPPVMNTACLDISSHIWQYLVKLIIPLAKHNKIVCLMFKWLDIFAEHILFPSIAE